VTIYHSSGKYQLLFQSLNIEDGFVITDSNVYGEYKHKLGDLDSIVLEPGEQTKSMAVYENLCRTLVQKGVTRKSKLVAFGGGVIGDLVGFVAATYMRGIDYIQVPTTLVSQIDSSVGGKTGIDLPEGKNLIGAFYPPREVHIDVSLLETLPHREFRSGIAEVIKTGLIQSPTLTTSLIQKPLTNGDDRILATVEECVQIKARIVQEDEFETLGLRAQLNFGHTIGHAIEQITKYCKYTHGEAIAIGMVVETMIAERLGIGDKELTSKVKFLMDSHGLPTKAVELKEAELIIAAMRKDKKSTKGELSMSLIRSVGECELVTNIEEGVVTEVLNEFAKG
jgi:3-dehydroquinate synthase